MKNAIVVVMFGVLVLGAPSRAKAQWPATFGIAQDVGYHVGGLIQLDPIALPVGFRVDGVMNQFNFPGGKTRIFDVSANLLYAMIPTPRIKPYVIAGLGFYGSRVTDSSELGSNDVGINAGAGVKFNLMVVNGFVDARFHHIFSDGGGTGFIPLSIGITF
jgi:hypothetical protein